MLFLDDDTWEWDTTEDTGLRSTITELRWRQSAYNIRTQEITNIVYQLLIIISFTDDDTGEWDTTKNTGF